MGFRNTLIGLVGTLFATQICWAQIETEVAQVPSLDPEQIEAPFVPGELIVGLESNDLALPLLLGELGEGSVAGGMVRHTGKL